MIDTYNKNKRDLTNLEDDSVYDEEDEEKNLFKGSFYKFPAPSAEQVYKDNKEVADQIEVDRLIEEERIMNETAY